MAIPIIAAAGAALAALYAALPDSVQQIGKEEFTRLLMGERDDFEKAAMAAAFERLGIEIDGDEALTPEFITRCVNEGPLAGTGVEFTNLFDREAVKRDMKKLAVVFIRDNLGLPIKGTRIEDVKEFAQSYVRQKIMEQVEAGGGDIIAHAPDLVALVRMIRQAQAAGRMDDKGHYIAPELKMDAKSISNRERQARYRATHKRVWVPR